jgi:hypothetical protein
MHAEVSGGSEEITEEVWIFLPRCMNDADHPPSCSRLSLRIHSIPDAPMSVGSIGGAIERALVQTVQSPLPDLQWGRTPGLRCRLSPKPSVPNVFNGSIDAITGPLICPLT